MNTGRKRYTHTTRDMRASVTARVQGPSPAVPPAPARPVGPGPRSPALAQWRRALSTQARVEARGRRRPRPRLARARPAVQLRDSPAAARWTLATRAAGPVTSSLAWVAGAQAGPGPRRLPPLMCFIFPIFRPRYSRFICQLYSRFFDHYIPALSIAGI
jgi:hypothetical protein